MEDSLGREISRAMRYKTPLAIIMLDLDYFKMINDTYGHLAGDLVLGKVGHYLNGCSRGEDVVCRYGGEEFVIIMPGASLESGIKRAEDICRGATESLRIKYREKFLPDITVSLGVASYPEHGETADLLLYNADNALYLAKKSGRNRIVSS
jgi:diguanylate cyclase (GGDEF)-like protein